MWSELIPRTARIMQVLEMFIFQCVSQHKNVSFLLPRDERPKRDLLPDSEGAKQTVVFAFRAMCSCVLST